MKTKIEDHGVKRSSTDKYLGLGLLHGLHWKSSARSNNKQPQNLKIMCSTCRLFFKIFQFAIPRLECGIVDIN